MMAKQQRTPRERIERAFHVSFMLPDQAAKLLDEYRDQVLAEAASLADAELPCRDDCDCTGRIVIDLILAARAVKEG